MSLIPKDAMKIEVADSSVDFFRLDVDDKIYFYFDTSCSVAPEPMVNAMAGLRLIDSKQKVLVMINHSLPSALFQRVDSSFNIEFEDAPDNLYKIVFNYKEGLSQKADLTQTTCGG